MDLPKQPRYWPCPNELHSSNSDSSPMPFQEDYSERLWKTRSSDLNVPRGPLVKQQQHEEFQEKAQQRARQQQHGEPQNVPPASASSWNREFRSPV